MTGNIYCCLSDYQQRIIGLYVLIDVFREIKGVTFSEDMMVILVMLVTVCVSVCLQGGLGVQSSHVSECQPRECPGQ